MRFTPVMSQNSLDSEPLCRVYDRGFPAPGMAGGGLPNCLGCTERTGAIGIGQVDEEGLGTAAYSLQEVSHHSRIAFTRPGTIIAEP